MWVAVNEGGKQEERD